MQSCHICPAAKPLPGVRFITSLQGSADVAGATGATETKDAISGSQAAAPEGPNGKPDDGLVYESYDPLRLKQNECQELLPFPTFDAALDEFYAKVRALISPPGGCMMSW